MQASMERALRDIGLVVTKSKVELPMTVMVVDRANMNPTEN